MARQSSGSKTTTDHQEIQQWVVDRGGHPARVTTTAGKNGPGILRIDYPGFSGEQTLEPIEWDEFFETFDKQKLAFVYQDKTMEDGEPSRFSKLVRRDRMGTRGRSAASTRTATRGAHSKPTRAQAGRTASTKRKRSASSTATPSARKSSATAAKKSSKTSASRKSSSTAARR